MITILELLKLQAKWKIVGITAHDLFNWYAGLIELCYHDQRMGNGNIKCWVDCGCPDDEKVSRDTRFGKQVAELIRKHESSVGKVLRESDVIDWFISRGALWLVLRNGSVVDERTVRLHGNACRSCRAVPTCSRDDRSQHRQSGYCGSCFLRLLPENVQWPYTRSTLKSYRVSRGFGIDYDPIFGTFTRCSSESDEFNREKARRDRDSQLQEASENDGNSL